MRVMTPTAKARNLRHNSTDVERLMWSLLRDRRLHGHKFRRQVPIGPYIVDFVCYRSRLIIEVDGGQHQLQVMHDNTRTGWLETNGFTVLRFWNNDLLANRDGVLEVIASVLEQGPSPSPSPSPSPVKGEGTTKGDLL